MKISGTIQIGEASHLAGRATKPLTGAPMPVIIANLAAGAVGLAGAVTLGLLRMPALLWIVWGPVLIVLASWVARKAVLAYSVPRFRRALESRGVENPLPTEIELQDWGLVQRSDGCELRVEWRRISECLRVGPYWVLIAVSQPVFVPRRWFADVAAERAFVDTCLARMDAAARARSRDAVRFADAAPVP